MQTIKNINHSEGNVKPLPNVINHNVYHVNIDKSPLFMSALIAPSVVWFCYLVFEIIKFVMG